MKINKSKLFILVAIIVTLISVYSYNSAFSIEKKKDKAGYSLTDSTVTKTYTCPMHPDIISDKPGSCPKCGMDLELKENSDKSENKCDVKNDKDMDHKNMEHKGCNGCMHKH